MNTLNIKQVSDTLDTLHEKAVEDSLVRKRARESAALNRFWDKAYMAVSREEGDFLYFLAKVAKAKNIVEFGCSFGVSTIYLAAAARDNGGTVITTDIEQNKVDGTKKNLEDAGLKKFVQILKGDARETLCSVVGPVDFLFLDGAKDLYLSIYEMLSPHLGKGAIVFADNADRPETQPFVDHILNSSSGFTAIKLFDERALVAYKI